jgi:phosphopantothenoylcysteine decarboxylase/phosphopantothenate--cysteine ligase
MGFALADQFASLGANVTLIAGPSNLECKNNSIKRIDIVSAEEMYNKCIDKFKKADIAIMAAAVADFTPEYSADKKIKKSNQLNNIKLKPTKDILLELGKRKQTKQILVGFALETDNEIENAKSKIRNKNLNFIVLNSLKDIGAGFKYSTNKISIINDKFDIVDFELKNKNLVAEDIAEAILNIDEK